MRAAARACALGMLIATLAASSAAFAHAVLVESVPADNAEVRRAPRAIVLRFNVRIEAALARATLNGPDASPRALTPLPPSPGHAERLEIPLPALAPGQYEVRYRVLAADGHTTLGALRFRVLP